MNNLVEVTNPAPACGSLPACATCIFVTNRLLFIHSECGEIKKVQDQPSHRDGEAKITRHEFSKIIQGGGRKKVAGGAQQAALFPFPAPSIPGDLKSLPLRVRTAVISTMKTPK